MAHPRAGGRALARRAGGQERVWAAGSGEHAGPCLPVLYKARPSLGLGPAPCLLAKFRPRLGPEGAGNLLR